MGGRLTRLPPYNSYRESRCGSSGPVVIDDRATEIALINPVHRGQKITSDENHGLGWRPQEGHFSGDVGGSFSSTATWIECNFAPQHILTEWTDTGTTCSPGKTRQTRGHTIGPVLAIPLNAAISFFPTHSLDSLGPVGTTAIARCKPTNNVANLATSIAELYRDGLPKLFGATLWKDRTRTAAEAGDEYLNSEFGWKPLVGDVRDLSYAAANAHEILESYERNSGKIVRRRYGFSVDQTVTVVNLGPTEGQFQGRYTGLFDLSRPKANLLKTTTIETRRWFSGAFTYHLPTGYKSRNGLVSAAAKAGPLLGIELTPEVLWNAAPWTWAIDWFSNTGDVISNLSDWATDGLVLKWGYIMETKTSKVSYFLDGPSRWRLAGGGYAYASPVTFYYETKRREKATPFGFATSWNTMSPRQLAIAAALGITRVFG